MNRRFALLLACVSSVGILHANSRVSPFVDIRDTFATFDKIFQELDMQQCKSEGHLSLSYTENDDVVTLIINGIKSDEEVSADIDGKALQIKIGACDIAIRARGRYLSIESVRFFETALIEDGQEGKDNMHAVHRVSELLTLSHPVYLDEMVQDQKSLSLDKKSGTLTILIPTKKATQALPIAIVDQQSEGLQEKSEE